ncbi:hypothetical protein [Cellulomonas sp. KRMCY2]|uniref:hypothetical protein n=1 Tax=Cellulomonas sp. KRMCY2 TaxID=1304865 RepID=UPI0012DBDFE4|nr:hypothetical protein [Cellulomonas sp. KRMCY2]
MEDVAWRVDLTDEDILAARNAWWDAYQRGAPPERVQVLWDGLGRLLRQQVTQLVIDFNNGRELT